MSINGVDVIYWINLDRSTERKTNMEKLFMDDSFDNIEKIRFSAIDGKNPNNIDKLINVEKKSISDLEYGCLLSHLEVIKEFLNSNYDICLIMEDDNTLDFKKYWKQDLKNVIDNAPLDWEAIMLSYISNGIPPYEYTYNKNEYWSTLSYVINKKGASNLIDNMYYNGKYKIDAKINNEADQYIFQKIKTYVYRYPYFIYKYGETSTLHQDAITRHNISRKRIEEMYNNESNFIEGFSNYIPNIWSYVNLYAMFFILIFSIILYYFFTVYNKLNKKTYGTIRSLFTCKKRGYLRNWFP